jgi:hypothetical protein
MKTYRLDLHFAGTSEGDLPGPARSHVCIKNCGRASYAKDVLLISLECVSLGELEYEIDQLHKELEAIRATAKRKYAAYHRLEGQRFAKRTNI